MLLKGGRPEAAELVDVFCVLLDKRVDHVLDGSRADEPLLVVDHGTARDMAPPTGAFLYTRFLFVEEAGGP